MISNQREAAYFLCLGLELGAVGLAQDTGPRQALGSLTEAVLEVGNETEYAVFHLEVAAAGNLQLGEHGGVHVFHVFDRFAEAFIDIQNRNALDSLDRLVAEKTLRWWEVGSRVLVPPPPQPDPLPVTLSGGSPTKIVRGGLGDLRGRGVIIAVVDSGVDFRHPAFWRESPETGQKHSKLSAYWDTTAPWSKEQPLGRPGPLELPDGRALGVVYSRIELEQALATENRLPPTLAEPDPSGHGTACAGITAGYGGDGRGGYAGVAPEAELVAVRVGRLGGLPHASLLSVLCDWLEQEVADGRPLVVSCSFGAQRGGRDGQSILERHLSAWVEAGAQRFVCLAAGNEGTDGIQGVAQLRPQETTQISWVALPALGSAEAGRPTGILEIYHAGQSADLVIQDGAGISGKAIPFRHPLSESSVVRLRVDGEGNVTLRNTSREALTANVYLSGRLRLAPSFERTFSTSNATQISYPGGSESVLTIGSYDFCDRYELTPGETSVFKPAGAERMTLGDISAYSNGGPLRRAGAMKPTLVAPGQWHLAPATGRLKGFMEKHGGVDSSGRYALFNGTSAATPYFAGVLALCLEANPAWTREDLLRSLKRELTGKAPRSLWGYGRLDYGACERLVAAARAARRESR